MIIECEECKSKFNVDEGLLRDEGTKVRCSLCKHVFKAYPPGMGPAREIALPELEDFEKTSTLETRLHSKEKEEADFDEELEEFGQELREEAGTLDFEEGSTKPMMEDKEKAALAQGLEEDSRVDRGPEREKAQAKIREKQKKTEKPSKVRRRGRSPLLPIILILVLLLLGGAAAVYFFAPQYIPEFVTETLPILKGGGKPDARDSGVRRLSFKDIIGSFVQSDKTGTLFIIKGMVANNYSMSRSFILIKGSVLDDKGKVVKTKLAYAANVFTENEIKELSLEQINQALRNRSGKGDLNVNVKPQAAIPFMVIFEELQENLSEFTVEAVSSSPGQ